MAYIVFLTSLCLMLVQVVSGRALAPYVGTSVYAWTGVIGTTLLGITFGYFAGGIMADKNGSRKTLGTAIALAGLAALASNYLVVVAGKYIGVGSMPLFARVFVLSFSAYFPVAFFLSTVVPQAVKLQLKDLGAAGSTYGSLAAWSALGNILGTFLGGYFLISMVGTKTVITIVAALLALLGLWVARDARIWRNRLALVSLLFFVGDILVPGVCTTETNYYCIRIQTATETTGARTHVLRLDHLVHSYVHEQDPLALGYDYEEVYANLIASRHATSSAFTAFFIGGGGYVFPRYLEAVYPHATAIVAEIDPGVTEANHRFMGLSRSTRTITHSQDARMALARGGDAPYDLVFGDAFNDFSVPSHLTTVEFHRLLKSRMSPDGVYALNIIDDARYGQFLASMLRTLSQVWTHVAVAPQADSIRHGRNTIVLIASDKPIDPVQWYATHSPASRHAEQTDEDLRTIQSLVPETDVQAFLAKHPEPALTDDFVPTDRYLAPVFADAY